MPPKMDTTDVADDDDFRFESPKSRLSIVLIKFADSDFGMILLEEPIL